MPRLSRLWLLAVLGLPGFAGAAGSEPARPRYQLEVVLVPAEHRLEVDATVTLPAAPAERDVDFLLNGALRLTASEPPAAEVPLGEIGGFFSINGMSADLSRRVALKRHRLRVPGAATTVKLRYQGIMDHPLTEPREEYTRGFRDTVGQIGAEGVYLSGGSFWYPHLGDALVEFTLTVKAPASWHVVSQGNGQSRGEDGLARWDSGGAMDEIYLVGGPLERFRDSAGAVETLVYLHERDEALAAKYLTATAQYLEMYRGLLGPYPYGKFALVENWWETGYGMPSFTLLGPKVIRFPFILASSYPHEILHNWWGNSVFVDYSSGNWCEGLTAYLADHLIQEQRGKGEEYRRATLQKYRDYVRAGRDFPIAEFRARESAATEAVGYGKTLMAWHMLRRNLGDETFRRWLATLYREMRGKRASFADLRRTAEAAAGRDLGWLFEPLVNRAGAAELAVSVAEVVPEGDGYVVRGELRQAQGGEAFPLDVPVVVRDASGVVTEVLRMDGASRPFVLRTKGKPDGLWVDPQFDLFRRLDPRETPASIGQIFGEPKVLALIPASAGDEERKAWRALLEGWKSDSHAVELRLDSEVAELPADRAVWLLGRGNRHAQRLFGPGSAASYALAADAIEVGGEKMALAGHSLVLTARHPGNVEKAIGWIVVEPAAAFEGLGRKLPHYGKYSYLGFEGNEPVNVLKGQLEAADSPLRVDLRPKELRAIASPALTLPARVALASLPPVFSEKALLEHVAYLAAPEREGRGLGSAGLAAARDYIAERMKAIGLQGGGDAGGFVQKLSVPGRDGKPVEVANVIGVVPGSRTEFAGQSVIVAAHYDHLGLGWPDPHAGNEGKVHPGADDNASGVAVLLELGRAFAGSEKPARSLVFAAFTAEESGRLGSKWYAEHAGSCPLAKAIGVINLDTVGRLGRGRVDVLGTGTASEWQHIFRGGSFVTGVESRNVAEPLPSSDQASFVERGVPAVQIFTGAHADYHRPGDTADKVDGAGLVKVATLVKEAVAYLAERPTPLTVTIASAAPTTGSVAPPGAPGGAAAGGAPGAGRRVSFGTVPDFGFAGKGVRVESVVAGSPAERAGVLAGDVLVALDGKPVASLSEYSNLLKAYVPGQTVKATLQRDGAEQVLAVTLVER